MDNNWENEGGAPAPAEEPACAVCGEVGDATVPSIFEPNRFLCEDAMACLDRVAEQIGRYRNRNA